MLKFKEAIYLYGLNTFVGGIEEIRTTEGYARIDYGRALMVFPGVLATPWHFLKEDSTLYIMREEPNFYA